MTERPKIDLKGVAAVGVFWMLLGIATLGYSGLLYASGSQDYTMMVWLIFGGMANLCLGWALHQLAKLGAPAP